MLMKFSFLVPLLSPISNLVIACAGAGILSFPLAMMKAGLVFGGFETIFFACLNIAAMRIIIRSCLERYHVEDCESNVSPLLDHEESIASATVDGSLHPMSVDTCPSSYIQLIKVRLGGAYYSLAEFSLYFGIIGVLIGFLIIIADLCCPVLEIWLSHKYSFFASRSFVVLFFAVGVACPLSSLPDLKSLTLSSILALLSVLFVVLVVVARSLESGKISNTPVSAMSPQGHNWVWSLCESMPIVLFAFGCPLQVVSATFEMSQGAGTETDKYANGRLQKMYVCTMAAVFICGCMYASVGMFGFLQFSDGTEAIILVNYGDSDTLANMAKLLMAIHVALAYPVVLFPAQQGFCAGVFMLIDGAFGDKRVDSTDQCSLAHGNGTLEDDFDRPNNNADVLIPNRSTNTGIYRILSAIFIAVITAIFAILIPQIEIVFGLLGSLVATTQVLVLPACLALKSSRGKQHMDVSQAVINCTLLAVGLLVGASGTVVYCANLFSL